MWPTGNAISKPWSLISLTSKLVLHLCSIPASMPESALNATASREPGSYYALKNE